MIYILAAVCGLIAGSVITALAEDPNPRYWLKRRSRCPVCGEILQIADLIPVISFVMLRGRCRHCNAIIPQWHIWTELTAVVLFVSAAFLRSDLVLSELVFLFVVLAVLLALSVIDFRFFILPDILVISVVLLGAMRVLFFAQPSWESAIIGGVVGAALLGSVSLFSGGRAMGWGDGKLSGALGILLGWQSLLVMLAIAFLSGGTVGGALLLSGKATRKSHIPFGPFLVFGAVLILLFPALSDAIFRFAGIVYY